MLRQVAALLIAAQVAVLAGTVVSAQPSVGLIHGCAEAIAGHLGDELVQPTDCDDCSMPACDHMIVCAAANFAVTNQPALVFFPLLAGTNEVDPEAVLPGSLIAPVLPPPRA